MKPNTCPYLGSREDPKTALDFPSEGNCCYHARPVAPVDASHQANFCLNGEYIYCPVYAMQQMRPLPAEIATPVARTQRMRRVLTFAIVPLALLTMAMLGTLLDRGVVPSQWLAIFNPPAQTPITFSIPNTGLFGKTPLSSSTPYLPMVITGTLRVSPSPVMAGNCAIPAGWTPYTVKPTDSLFRLSVLYGTNIQALQEANCLGSQTVVQPGSVIFVPELPTSTPTNTATQPPRPIQPVPATPLPPPAFIPIPNTLAPTATPIVPTAAPPTDIPPTNVPPTNIPPTDALPTEAPPPTAVPPPTEVPPTDVPPTAAPASIRIPPLPITLTIADNSTITPDANQAGTDNAPVPSPAAISIHQVLFLLGVTE